MPFSFDLAWQWWIALPWNVWLDYTDKIVKIGAVVVGGSWAYMKFVKGRIYRDRLEPAVTGRVVSANKRNYVIATVTVKNVGASKVDITQRGTALRAFAFPVPGYTTPEADLQWTRLNTLSLFEQNSWIEGTESVSDTIMFPIAKNILAVTLQVRIVAKKQQWYAKTIIDMPEGYQ
jgi:hypothetical protein